MIILGVSYTVQIVVHYFTIMLSSSAVSSTTKKTDRQLLLVDGHILAELRSSLLAEP